MITYKVSAVSYLNTIPFLYGIEHFQIIKSIDLELDYPSLCAKNLLRRNVDIALVPVVSLVSNNELNIVSEYCIGSDGHVDTVGLYSDVPIEMINEILLDYQSHTSVKLLKILCKDYWNIDPKFISSVQGFESRISGNTAGLIIGDRAFSANSRYKYCYDLSQVWKELTGLPFVFACWMSNDRISEDFLVQFNHALSYGVNNLDKICLDKYGDYSFCSDPMIYLKNRISYRLTQEKREAMRIFLSKINDLDL